MDCAILTSPLSKVDPVSTWSLMVGPHQVITLIRTSVGSAKVNALAKRWVRHLRYLLPAVSITESAWQ
jgi:uncharacterized protein YejL (UPF0352 family)